MRTIIAIICLFLVSLFPLSTKAQAPVPQAVTEEEVNRFLDEYKARYMKMDLDAFMDLFSEEAVENRVIPYDDIRRVYKKNFDNSSSLEYDLEIDSIQAYQKSAFVSGRYRLIQTIKGTEEQKGFKGNIQWSLVRENGSLKIKEINYGRSQ
jgi:hypothetical protein